MKKFIESMQKREQETKALMDKLNEPMRQIKAQMELFNKPIQLMKQDIERMSELTKFPDDWSRFNSDISKFFENTALTNIIQQAVKKTEFLPLENKNLNTLTFLPPITSTSEKINIHIDIIKESDEIDVSVSQENGKIVVRVKKSEDK